MSVSGKFGSCDDGLLYKRGVQLKIGCNGVIRKSRVDVKRDGKKDSVLRKDFVLAVVKLSELEQETVANFTVKCRGSIAVKPVVSIFPKKNHLDEEEGDEPFGPDLACELLVIHVEVSVVSLLTVSYTHLTLPTICSV